ncbi:MAG: class I SAM-dependent methyltransferase [Bryobacteraceae bacterium]
MRITRSCWIFAFVGLVILLEDGSGQSTGLHVHPVTGRVIAPTMSVEGADWLDRPERERQENPEEAVAALHLVPGMNVGEIGAGTGYYALRIAKRISPGGTYYANDIQPGMLARLQSNAAAQKVTNVKPVLGTQRGSGLPAGSLDYVVMVDVYHELSEPQLMLRDLAKALKPNGELVLLEFRKEDANVPIRPEHKMSTKEVVAELSAEHYVLDHKVETLPWQHLLFFRRSQ